MKKIAEVIKNAENIVITAHINEDADALGSVFALSMALRNMGKNVTALLSDIPERRLQFLDFPYEVYKEGAEYPQDLLICLDSADVKRLGDRASLLEKSQSISIDHHYTNTNYAKINHVEGGLSATGEIIYKLILELGGEITKEIAEFLYVAISGDTGSFKYSSTSSETMRVVADLMEKGIDHAELSRRIHETESLESVILKGHIMSHIKSLCNGKVNMVVLNDETFKKFGVSEKDVGDIVNIPRMIEGTEVAVSVREVPEKIKLSFRSNGRYNVSDIAGRFGGGGHEMAAGAAVFGKTLAEVEEEIVKVLGEYIND